MKNSIAGALVAIPLVAADLLAAGCGGGDDAGELTLKDYFVGLEVLLDDLAGSVDDDEIFAETDKSASVEEQGESLAGVYASFAEHTVGFSDISQSAAVRALLRPYNQDQIGLGG